MKDGKKHRTKGAGKKRVQLDVRVQQLEKEVEGLRTQLAEKTLHKRDRGFTASQDPWTIIAELREDNRRLRERLGE